ncbi:MotA/TolQ/ExbB proton channel family protein [Myxococcus sp. CA051A]|uniref:MotA/TolQ/ExbB proton channel family protein n=1 Tax=Myxococcus llanfairpwllgwyngyllgogerychwyrndrobwllllantysiliogogogochensis TaxID=2590453 RepID=A0A540WKK5_9BACT|nr:MULTISPECIES: MotA/TolQ/ExbB proton channel family protein [Myxococcus]NTX03631.1 MotA/TolQ/ExbB proton channel family protein [Myxococcus sp. CA040A]NTX14205.1 MotA/TolQ/ExbB proton channel family protein [Myxococcus sp. CA056]NTX35409.1 MotA/TolQ/ExbB proton channel family protein [Myxococcus sp. CA033]NTX56943.1 MotA/TolQ/ExbB proton channel family protein [Myxococcus sp. CA039A]NTX62187.1 MotA/TolQ/ExbB proton channel family protein [Myxococcus sp. CA051A]
MISSVVSELLVNASLAAADAGKLGVTDSVIKFFKDGGPFMFVNLFWLACALAVALERIVTLVFRYNLNPAPFMEQISKLVRGGNLDRAVKVCGMAPTAPLAKVIRAGLVHANRGEIEVAKAVEEALIEHSPHVSKRIPWLWSLANIATLVGLVGTIFGLIGTFQALGDVPADQKQRLLSDGISKAMNNTAFALSIAVVCIIFHLFLTSYAKSMVESLELNALKLENLLSRRGSVDPAATELEARAS